MGKWIKGFLVGVVVAAIGSPSLAQGRAVAVVGDTIAVSVKVTDVAGLATTIPADALWNVTAYPANTVTWFSSSGVGDPGTVRGLVSNTSAAGFAQVTLTVRDPASPSKYWIVPSAKFTILAANQPTPAPTIAPVPTAQASYPANGALTIVVEKAK